MKKQKFDLTRPTCCFCHLLAEEVWYCFQESVCRACHLHAAMDMVKTYVASLDGDNIMKKRSDLRAMLLHGQLAVHA